MPIPVDPKTAELAGIIAKPIVEKGIAKLGENALKVKKAISASAKILGTEMTISCPEGIQKYSVSLEAKPSGVFGSKVKFDFGPVNRAIIRPIIGMQPIDAVLLTQDGFELNLKKLKQGEMYILDVEYSISDPRFTEALVERNHARETVSGELNKYWMVAQLKHVDVLRSKFGRIALNDVDFNVNVGVYEDVNTKVPRLFRDQLETLVKLAGPLGQGERFRAYDQFVHMKSRKYGTNDLKLLGELLELFAPPIFSTYLDVTQDFHYADCQKGANAMELPFGSWPKFMRVISRTDLGLEKPASSGSLVYKRKDFLKKVEEIFK